MRWWLAVGLLIGLLMPLAAFPCDQHPVPEWDNGLIRVVPLETTGLFGFWYDSDKDGVAELALIFQQDHKGNFISWPLFYFYDVDSTGKAEEVWIDQNGRGECRDIILYYKRTVRQR